MHDSSTRTHLNVNGDSVQSEYDERLVGNTHPSFLVGKGV